MKTERQQDQDVAERLRRENLELANATKDNEVDEKVTPVAWRYWSATPAAQVNILGPGQYEYIDAGKWHPDRAEPLYSAATVAELRAKADAAERRVGECLKLAEVLGVIVQSPDVTIPQWHRIAGIADEFRAALTGADPT